jgi:glutamine synthetase
MTHPIQDRLRSEGVRFVRLLWCDHANVIRARAVHVEHSEGLRRGVAITRAQQALPVMVDAVAPGSGLGPIGRARLAPDWSTLTPLPFAPDQAQVLCDMRDGDAPWEHCPRELLREQVARLRDRDLELRAAFENEFFLLRRDDDGALTPLDRTVYAATGAMNLSHAVIGDIADALIAQGLRVEGTHPESGPGQHEMTVAPADPLAAADRQVVFRETVRGVAQRHGLIASFLPKIFADSAGSGCHLNLGLRRRSDDITADGSVLGTEARAFLAGLLDHLPALSALTLASSNSYRRIRPNSWAGAYRCWGTENREAAVRVSLDPESDRPSHLELKSADASANPYLALAGAIAAGLDGIERGLEPPAEVTVDPGTLDDDERERLGIDPLPQNLGEALDALDADAVLLDALGEARARAYRAVKRMEWDALADADLDDEVALLAERY